MSIDFTPAMILCFIAEKVLGLPKSRRAGFLRAAQ